MRYKVIEDAKLKAIIEAKDLLVKEGQEKQKEVENLNKEIDKLVLKINRYNEKAVPMAKKYMTDDIGEFEEYTKVYLTKEEPIELRLEIIDAIEEFKAVYKEKKEKKEEKK